MDRHQIIAELTGTGGAFETRETTVVGVPMKVYANAPPSMRAVFESTRAFADREFLIYDDERWTYADLHQRVRALAHLLHERGIRKGDRVAIGMRNYPEWRRTCRNCRSKWCWACATRSVRRTRNRSTTR